jgi:hypothetical protein
MTSNHLSRLLRTALVLACAGAASSALAQVDFTVALTPAIAPIANAVTQGQPSSLSFDVRNLRAGTQVTQVIFRVPGGYTVLGGAGPPGWAVTQVSAGASRRVYFQVANCAQGAITTGNGATFRVDFTPPSGGNQNDATVTMTSVTPSDPCNGTSGWNPTNVANFPFQRKVLYVTAAAAPTSGASPLTESVTFTVRNQSTVAKNGVVVATPTVTASSGATATPTGCNPASLNLAANGGTGTVTCGYTLTAASGSGSTFTFASTANGPSATAVGATAGPIAVGAATASFAFDDLAAGPGDSVQATLKVTNNTSGPITVTPPTYAQLSVSSSLTRGTGTTDPVAEAVAAGATAIFVYQFTVSGQVSDLYVVSGTAQTTAQPTNLATTPAGRVASTIVNMTPEAIVQSRKAPGPYTFVVTVVNKSRLNVNRIDVVNPQNNTWTALNDNGGSTFGATPVTGIRQTPVGTTDTLRFSGTLTAGATATLNIRFTAIPVVTTTALYNFTVAVRNVNNLIQSFTETVADTFPIGDVSNLSILSDATGQTLSWTNTSRADEPHDGVVVFKVAQPTVPASPADGTDYSIGSPAGVLYFDKDDSPIAGVSDSGAGAFNYRVCNHDANFVYSNCNSGFWNNAGWLDSVVAPANGAWANALGGQMLLLPGIIPGGLVGAASNVPNVNLLDADTGQRTLPAVALPGLPSAGTPVAPLADGHQVLFAADQSGNVTAVDVTSGAIYWQVSKSPSTFVAGVNGALRQYAHPSFQAAYSMDVLFLGSSQAAGTVLAVNASTGATLWTVSAGWPIRADIYYDATRNWIYVPTFGGGILAYDLTGSSPGTAPSAAATWLNTVPNGAYTLGCTYEDAASVICVDTAGVVRVLNSSTGAVVANFSSLLASPSTLWAVPGGLVVSNASSVKRLAIAGGTITLAGTYTPGVQLSSAQVFVANGLVYVAGSDRKLHKVSLSTLAEVGSVSISSQGPSNLVGPPAYDVVNDLFIFGDGNGRLWTVKSF